MRIVHICPNYLDPDVAVGGAERYAYALAKAMSAKVPVTLVTFGNKSFMRREKMFTFKCFKALGYVNNNTLNPLSLRHLLELKGADIIHCYQFGTVIVDAVFLGALLSRKKVFVTDLGGTTDFSFSYHLPLWKAIQSFLLVSRHNGKPYLKFPIPQTIIYGGVDAEKFIPGTQPKLGRFLTVGRFFEAKGIEFLIEALDPDMSLDVVGQVVDERYFEKLKTVSFGKQVRFLTQVSDKELITLYQQALATIVPAIIDGGYTTVLESMACATPALVSQVGSLPELIEDNVTGLFAPPADPQALKQKLRYLMQNPEMARRMGQEGRRRAVEQFDWQAVVDQFLKAYGI
ncbi:MAG: glycosyltransferase family 4 protein [Candidatus Omnitrophica bacterium]|nr:glycosyltransferase family 4 protein [Candidatus Omnitrophota bacterium]